MKKGSDLELQPSISGAGSNLEVNYISLLFSMTGPDRKQTQDVKIIDYSIISK